MSREDNFKSRQTNPCNFKLTWDNSSAGFKVYDSEQKTNTKRPLPITFAIIDTYVSVTGFNEKANASNYSNEIKNLRTEPLNVKCGTLTLASGLYGQIKGDLEKIGGKFTENLYVMFSNGKLGRIQLTGSNVKLWMDFKQKNGVNLTKNWITFNDAVEKTKGSIKWYEPTIVLDKPLTDKEDASAELLYDTLKAYKTADAEIQVAGRIARSEATPDEAVAEDAIPKDFGF